MVSSRLGFKALRAWRSRDSMDFHTHRNLSVSFHFSQKPNPFPNRVVNLRQLFRKFTFGLFFWQRLDFVSVVLFFAFAALAFACVSCRLCALPAPAFVFAVFRMLLPVPLLLLGLLLLVFLFLILLLACLSSALSGKKNHS